MTVLHNDLGKSADDEEKKLKIFVKQMLIHQTFEGVYQERRWTQNVNEYRDLVVISQDGNKSFLEDLEVVRKRLFQHYKGSKWIGITAPNVIGAPAGGYCLWLNLHDTPLGKHKFRVRKVKFYDKEIYLDLKSTSGIDNLSTSTEEDRSQNDSQGSSEGEPSFNYDSKSLNEISSSISAVITKENSIEALRYLSVLVAFIVTGSCKIIYNSGDFTLKLMDRLTHFIKVIMPLLLSIVDLVKKTIGGFYILLSMMWNSYQNPNRRYVPPPQAIQYQFAPPPNRRYQQPRNNYK